MADRRRSCGKDGKDGKSGKSGNHRDGGNGGKSGKTRKPGDTGAGGARQSSGLPLRPNSRRISAGSTAEPARKAAPAAAMISQLVAERPITLSRRESIVRL
jgi:hypothetical protein